MGRLGWPELIIVLVIVLILFGAARLPGIARSIGSSAREFRKGFERESSGDEDEASNTSGQDD